jgi:hypothetical protein
MKNKTFMLSHKSSKTYFAWSTRDDARDIGVQTCSPLLVPTQHPERLRSWCWLASWRTTHIPLPSSNACELPIFIWRLCIHSHALCRPWNVKPEPITMKNPRANTSSVEQLHKLIADMLRCKLSQQHPHDRPVEDMLSDATYGVCATVHGTTQCAPGQLVFSKDKIEVDMEMVRLRRQSAAQSNNPSANKWRIKHNCKPGNKVLLLTQQLDHKMKFNEEEPPTMFCIILVWMAPWQSVEVIMSSSSTFGLFIRVLAATRESWW